jgi:hypothetical protein
MLAVLVTMQLDQGKGTATTMTSMNKSIAAVAHTELCMQVLF